jgi:hypothetical protein
MENPELEIVEMREKVRRLRERLVNRCMQRCQENSGRPSLPILPEQRLVRSMSLFTLKSYTNVIFVKEVEYAI